MLNLMYDIRRERFILSDEEGNEIAYTYPQIVRELKSKGYSDPDNFIIPYVMNFYHIKLNPNRHGADVYDISDR